MLDVREDPKPRLIRRLKLWHVAAMVAGSAVEFAAVRVVSERDQPASPDDMGKKILVVHSALALTLIPFALYGLATFLAIRLAERLQRVRERRDVLFPERRVRAKRRLKLWHLAVVVAALAAVFGGFRALVVAARGKNTDPLSNPAFGLLLLLVAGTITFILVGYLAGLLIVAVRMGLRMQPAIERWAVRRGVSKQGVGTWSSALVYVFLIAFAFGVWYGTIILLDKVSTLLDW